MLLEDLKLIFANRRDDRLRSADLAEALSAFEDRPWPEWHQGKPITPRQIAKLLEPFDLAPSTIRTTGGTAKGYKLEQFTDAFARYLPGPLNQTVTTSQEYALAGFCPSRTVTSNDYVTDENVQKATVSDGCDGVTDGEPPRHRVDDANVTDEETTWTV